MDPASLQTLECAAEVRAPAADGRTFAFTCSTESEDSHGSVVMQDWDLARYQANPVVFLNHASGSDLPIGRASNVAVRGGRLVADITVVDDDAHPLAPFVARQLRDGTLRGCSVGFLPRDCRFEQRDGREVLVFSRAELFELSIVGVPSNPDCLMRLRSVARASASSRAAVAAASPTTEQSMKFMPLAARLGVASSGEEAAEAALLALAEEGAQARAALGSKSAAESAAKLAELAAAAATLPKVEAELAALRAVEEKRAAAERRAHVEALVEARPELGDARDALEAFAAADYERFAKRYPRPAQAARERALTSQLVPQGGAPSEPVVHAAPARRSSGSRGVDFLERADEIAGELMSKDAGLDYRAALSQATKALRDAQLRGMRS